MDLSNSYLVKYFFLLAIAVVMIVNSIFRFKQHSRTSIYVFVIIGAALLLSVAKTLELYGKSVGNVGLTTFCAFFGYVINPLCVYFFILMSGEVKNKKMIIIGFIPLIINLLVFVMMFIPPLKHLVVYFENVNGTLEFRGGPVRFSSHLISALYLVYLIYFSITRISSKHVVHGCTIIACSAFVVIAVIIESLFNKSDTISLLPTTIAFSTVVYYLYLYVERAQIDTLTNLYNRETYYHDIAKMDRLISGVIQFDMNGLKHINDTYGHLEGDKAISDIASVIASCAKRNMYCYRLGGDEFILIGVNATRAQLDDAYEQFKEKISRTEYKCSVGYAYRDNKKQSMTELFKEAERKMYEDKEAFYKTAKFDRRKQ